MTLALIALTPFLGAALPALLIRSGRDVCAMSAAAVTLTALGLLAAQAPLVIAGGAPQVAWDWIPAIGLQFAFRLDGLGLLFAGLILGIGLLIILYARFYLAKTDPMGRFYAYLLLFQGAMVGIVLSDDVLLLLVFWELTSLSSFLLIGYWRHAPEGRRGARMALAVTGMGGLAMVAGMLILADIAGTTRIGEIIQAGDAIKASPYYAPALILILLGCFTKSAQFPFHFWLPHAMAAPTPVSAYLHSATMVKAGIFLMARLWPALAGTELWFDLVATIGLITMLLGAWIALFKDDLKALLAFSTVSHLGLITMLLGFGTKLGVVAAVFHIINHATFKAALFMTAGIVDHEAHTRSVARLGGLRTLMPVTFAIAAIASLSMAGLPPLNGFLSKEMMLEESVHAGTHGGGWLFPILATLGALISVAYCFRFLGYVFLGPVRDDYPHKPHDPGFGMWAAPAFLCVLVVLIGFAPASVAEWLVMLAADAAAGGGLPDYHLALWHGFTPALGLSLIATAGGLALLLAFYGPAVAAFRMTPLPAAPATYRVVIGSLAALCARAVALTHDGALRHAFVAALLVAVAVGLWGWGGAPFTGLRPLSPVPVVGLPAAALLIVASLSLVVLHRQRLLTLILTSVVGLIVSLGFLFLSAPDLALTQISVEVATTILMLLTLNFLPKTTPVDGNGLRRLRDGAIAAVAGLGTAALAFAMMTRDGATISDFYLDNSYDGGGGTNVVNVILVDFRGFDTFGEISVLGIAALGIYALIDGLLSGPARKRVADWAPDMVRSKDRHPMMLVVATRVMLPLVLLVGVYILLRGHNEPGGGFIAGLIVSIALLMQYMASGYAWTADRQPFDYHGMIGLGVLLAGLTGLGAMARDLPFLTSAFGYVTLWPLEKFELATAMLFDLGVFLTVVGAVMLALANLSRLAQAAEPQPRASDPMDVDPRRMPDARGAR
jgi:multicomponent K+:H+ antiporter subunit A